MRRTEKIVDIREADIKNIRSDFESEGAEVDIKQQAGRYVAIAKFPVSRGLKILGAMTLLIVIFVAWRAYRTISFRNELSRFHLPPDLYERQEQLESLSIHQNDVVSLNWLHSRLLTDLSIASSKLDSIDGLRNLNQLRSLDLDLNGASLNSLDSLSALHRLNTLVLHNPNRRKTALIPDVAAFPELTKLYLDFNGSPTKYDPDFSKYFSRCPELPRAQESPVAPDPFGLREPSPSTEASPSPRSLRDLIACQQLRDIILNLRGSTAIAAVPNLSKLNNLRAASVLVDLSHVEDLKSLATVGVRDLTLSVDGTQLPMLSVLNDNQSVRSLTLSITSPPNSSLPNLGGMHGLLSLRLDMPGARGGSLPDKSKVPDITYLKQLQQLTIALNESDATTLPPIGLLTDLHSLTLQLQSSGVYRLPDLSPLHDLDRLELNISNTNIRDVPNFAAWPKLSFLSLGLAHSQISSLRGIEDLPLLESLILDIQGADVHDLHRILLLSNLRHLVLYLGWEQIYDLPDVMLISSLRSLELHITGLPGTEKLPQLGSLAALEELTLDLKGSHITMLPDLSLLQHLRKVTLNLEGSDIQDLSGLERLSQLEDLHLDLRSTHIKSLPNLQLLRNLQAVTADISHSSVPLSQTSRVAKLQELTVDSGFSSLRDLPKTVKRIVFVP